MMFKIFKKEPTVREQLQATLETVRGHRRDREEDEHWNRKQKEYYAEREARLLEELSKYPDAPVQKRHDYTPPMPAVKPALE
jgi:hypothetical protein